MADKWTNPDPRIHTDMLRGQLRIFTIVADRMHRDGRMEEYGQLTTELAHLRMLISKKTRESMLKNNKNDQEKTKES